MNHGDWTGKFRRELPVFLTVEDSSRVSGSACSEPGFSSPLMNSKPELALAERPGRARGSGPSEACLPAAGHVLLRTDTLMTPTSTGPARAHGPPARTVPLFERAYPSVQTKDDVIFSRAPRADVMTGSQLISAGNVQNSRNNKEINDFDQNV